MPVNNTNDNLNDQENPLSDDPNILEAAKQIILEHGAISTSLLQRKLHIGYPRVFKILKILKQENFLGPYDPKIRNYTVIAKRVDTNKKQQTDTPKLDVSEQYTTLYCAAPHTERDFDWEIESIKRQYQERIEYVLKSDRPEEEKQEEIRILRENSFHDPRLPNIFYDSPEHAKERRRIAQRLDSIRKEDFLTMPYVRDWSQNKPNSMTWIFNLRGDITSLEVDAIVDSVENTIINGNETNMLIHAVAGPELFNEITKIKNEKYPIGLPTGEAFITKAYGLPSKFIIHTAGPIWLGGFAREEELLYKCYLNSLLLAKEHNIKIIAFPEISVGLHGYPRSLEEKVANRAISDFCKQNQGTIEEILLIIP